MDYTDIRYGVADRIATITLNRPENRNGYTVRMSDEIADALEQANLDPDVRVVVLTAAGETFCVGMDLAADGLNGADEPGWVEPATRVCRPMYALDKPVICAVRGAAVGVGSTMLLPADYRLAARDARFGFVFTRRGIFPEGGSTWFLPRIVGLGRAMDWMISGRLIPADEALAAGLVHSIHEPEAVLDAAYDLARELVAVTAPVSTAVIRQTLLRMSGFDSPEPAFALDSKLIGWAFVSPDAAEGIGSFLQRRAPQFSGTVPADLPPFLPWRAEATSETADSRAAEPTGQLKPQKRSRRIAMTDEERDAFLATERTCRVASVGSDGPHATPLWYGWDGRHLWLYSIVKSQRWADLMRDPRIGIVIDAGFDYLELRGVEISGTVEVIGSVPRTGAPEPALAAIEAQFAEKYMGGGELVHDGRHGWLRVTPTKITSWDFRKLAAL